MTVEDEIRLAIRDYVHSQPRERMRRYCETAEDWHDGRKAMMQKFWKHGGQLENGAEYARLAKESAKAAASVNARLENSADHIDALIALSNFASQVSFLERQLVELSALAEGLAQSGMPTSAAMVFQTALSSAQR